MGRTRQNYSSSVCPAFIENGPSSIKYKGSDSRVSMLPIFTAETLQSFDVGDLGLTSLSTSAVKDGELDAELDAHDFHEFSEFPPDIKKIVWEFACYIPRTVPIWIADKSQLPPSMTGDSQDRPAYSFATDSPTPIVMRVCQESRYAAFKVYKRIFHVRFDFPLVIVHSPGRIWINAETDLICPTRKGPPRPGRFDDQHFHDICATIKYNKIGNLAIDDQSSSGYTFLDHDNLKDFVGIPSWMGPHIKNIVQYTTRDNAIVDMKYPLNLVNYTNETVRIKTLPSFQKTQRILRILLFKQMLEELDAYQSLQQSVNRAVAAKENVPRAHEKALQGIPTWLRENVDTYIRPALYSMVALQ
ncbi:hypothetical protein EYC80_010198 [Monilinia laxa]|uniref:2EXR domain-containing protein n=1 Tax=Monilinia laxa TaxID=61186 RepID=A0A5N6JLT5_MONLA|nr:hypothetical protein EYC80_010198 [Monilinia laxa]